MSRALNGAVLIAIVIAIGCGGGSSSSKKKPRVQQTASVNMDLTLTGLPGLVTFAGVQHQYDSGADQTTIVLDLSTPTGWSVNFVWDGDVDPGSRLTSTVGSGGFVAVVEDPLGEIFFADETTAALDVTSMTVTTFAPKRRSETSGTFSGSVGWTTDPANVWLDLTLGTFVAARQ